MMMMGSDRCRPYDEVMNKKKGRKAAFLFAGVA